MRLVTGDTDCFDSSEESKLEDYGEVCAVCCVLCVVCVVHLSDSWNILILSFLKSSLLMVP